MTAWSVLLLGLFLGVRHATDADHVVAVSTLATRERSVRSAALLGGLWGVGHTVTILGVGGAIVVLGLVIPPRLGLGLEMAVAVMLVLLGALNLTGATRRLDAAAHAARDAAERAGGLSRGLRSLAVGLVHGLAGSAAVALLVLTTVRDSRAAFLFLAVFGLGTVVGMMGLTVAMFAPLALAARRLRTLPRTMATLTGVLSLGFGLFLFYRLGFVDGLFLAHPTWTPQ